MLRVVSHALWVNPDSRIIWTRLRPLAMKGALRGGSSPFVGVGEQILRFRRRAGPHLGSEYAAVRIPARAFDAGALESAAGGRVGAGTRWV